MKNIGIFLCFMSIGILSIIIGIASIAQQIDMLKGDFYNSLFIYIDWVQWLCVILIFCIGLILYIKGNND